MRKLKRKEKQEIAVNVLGGISLAGFTFIFFWVWSLYEYCLLTHIPWPVAAIVAFMSTVCCYLAYRIEASPKQTMKSILRKKFRAYPYMG